ncbi:MAG TPA: FtsX-like permease family protein [Trebonia sp.]|jgi:hypothetical protein|nr:FtsX-like permease family protein [Trebonia sp.]
MILRLGLRLTLSSGREALTRLLLVAGAVAVGVGILLSVLASFNAFSATNNRQCWECTTGTRVTAATQLSASSAELWNYSKDYYEGKAIERLDVAALGPGAPTIPGLTRMPGPGQVYVSPALASLLKTVPSDELGARFPGTQVGEIGNAGLSGPDELAIVIGYTPQQLAALPATQLVRSISTSPAVNSSSSYYEFGFGLILVGLIVPLVVLIGTATRLAAARREERFAALRLVGATSNQVNVIASVDALAGAIIGTLVGLGVFQLLQPVAADIEITGSRYFPALVNPSGLEYAIALVGVPVAAAFGALWSLQRVRISPLGAARKTTPPAPRAWRVLPLLIGLALFIIPIAAVGKGQVKDFPLIDVGLVLIMGGLIVGGSWLTMQAARLVAVFSRGAASLLAARRLSNDPKGTFRSVSGLVLAVFLGTAIAGIVPAILAGQQNVGSGTLKNVLRVSFAASYSGSIGAHPGSTPASLGLSGSTGAQLLSRLHSYPGVTVLPLYVAPGQSVASQSPLPTPGGPPSQQKRQPSGISCGADGCSAADFIVSCQSLRQFSELGTCGAGATAVRADFGGVMVSDNLLGLHLPIVGDSTTTASSQVGSLALGGVLVKTNDAATTERVRTLLTEYTALAGAVDAPETFGEVAQARSAQYEEIQQIALVVVWLTILVAGCSLAIAVCAGVVERKRPFTLIRLTGTPTRALYGVVLLESMVPLLTASIVAAGVGLAVAVPIVKQFASKSTSVALPGSSYFLSMGVGIIVSLLVIAAALPLLNRVTDPNDARFE